MKFLTEKKKLFALIAMICLALTFVSSLLSLGGSLISSFNYMFDSFGQFLISSVSILTSVIGLLASLCYVAAAFFVWKKDNHMKILGIAGLINIVVMFLGIVSYLISSITYGYFNFGVLVTQILGYFLPFVFAAYLIVFSFMKVKGPVVPIVGAVLIVLLCGSALLGAISLLITNIVNMFDYFSWAMVWSTITGLLNSAISMIGNIGLLLLVPAAFYIPKEEAEIIEETVAEAAEEAPIAEEAPAAE